MTRKPGRQEKLANEIRRQFADLSTSRFLRAMPAFKVVSDIPDHMKDLLDRLEASERQSRTPSRP